MKESRYVCWFGSSSRGSSSSRDGVWSPSSSSSSVLSSSGVSGSAGSPDTGSDRRFRWKSWECAVAIMLPTRVIVPAMDGRRARRLGVAVGSVADSGSAAPVAVAAGIGGACSCSGNASSQIPKPGAPGGDGTLYGKGTSRKARNRWTLVQCSFSTRKTVHMPRRQISLKETKKLRSAECWTFWVKMA